METDFRQIWIHELSASRDRSSAATLRNLEDVTRKDKGRLTRNALFLLGLVVEFR